MPNSQRLTTFLSYYSDPQTSPPTQTRELPPRSHQQPIRNHMPPQQSARQPLTNVRAPPQAQIPPQYRQQRPPPQYSPNARPNLPNIQKYGAPKPTFIPPVAAFNHEKAPSSLSPVSPIHRKGSSPGGQDEYDDRYAGSNIGSQTAHMDFWKRFSMVAHDAQLEEKGLKKKSNTWLKKQTIAAKNYKTAIWVLTAVILIAIGAALAWHFTHNDNKGVTQPSTHDFGLSPKTSTNPLATVTLNAGPAKRTSIPSIKDMQKRMHKRRKQNALTEQD